MAELAQQQTQQCQIAAQLAQVKTDIASTATRFDADTYASILVEEKSLREQSGSLQTQVALLGQEQRRDEAEVTALHAEKSRLAAVEDQQKTLGEQSSALESIRNLLRQAGPFITAAVVRQVSSGAAQIFGEIMQDFSRRLSWDEDFGISLNVDGVVRQFAQLSGGEQMSAALAVRLALVREMSKLDVAFFDEPTANLDDLRREALAQQIMNIRGFRQLIVISHDDTFEQATQNLIRIRRQGATSVVIRDENF
jgi:exonuclease SbcC